MKMMNSEQKHTDFSLYTFEEFLQNDFFISSMNYPTEETQKFWDEFEQMNPSNIDEYIAAKRYLEVFSKEKEEVLSNEETEIGRAHLNSSHRCTSRMPSSA